MNKILTILAILGLAFSPVSAQKATQKKGKAKATAKTPQQVQAEKALAEKMAQMTQATQKVTVFDSLVIDKAAFIAQYRLSKESGRVMGYDALFGTDEQPNAYAYVNELGNKSYYSLEDAEGNMSLYTSDKVAGAWSKPHLLDGLDDGGQLTELNYPYMMADGVTLYFAAKGEASIGGYDIFVTRYDASTDSYLKPENIGMPFNSTGNDYMYAVDELNDIGWFVTDRNQTAGKVCIYLFVPTTKRQTYAEDGVEEAKLHSLARLENIADTWGDGTARDEALQRLASSTQATSQSQSKKEFTFVVNDKNVYTQLADFRSKDAKAMMRKLTQTRAKYDNLSNALERARNYYSTASDADRKALASEIVKSERQQEQMEADMAQMEKAIRNLEIPYTKK